MIKRTQNRIAQSRWALPTTLIYGIALFLASGMAMQGLWLQLFILCASTLLMVVLNNTHSLIRIYSRMVSCTFFVVAIMSPYLFSSVKTELVQLFYIIFLNFFLRSFQDKQAVGNVFYGFVAIGMASVVYVDMLWLVPVLWILLGTNVLALSMRTFFASLLGLMLPYWFLGAYSLYTGNGQEFVAHFTALATWQMPFNFASLDLHHLVTLAFIILVGMVGSIHFLIYSYQDKIRIRMIYEMFIALEVILLLLLVLQPQHSDVLLSLLTVTVAPPVGHFLTLTHSRLSNITFFCLITAALALTVFNVWFA